ncbi:MAG TPA: hypothetical protein VGF55_17690 [Gemmataceae bacterium]
MDRPNYLPAQEIPIQPGFRESDEVLIRLLWQADQASRGDRWQEAVPRAELQASGVQRADLVRLIRDGLLEYRVETTTARSKRRTFRTWHSLAIPAGSCFLLTGLGAELAGRRGNGVTARHVQPQWDGERLWWGDKVAKRPAQRAKRQRAILAQFEREGWPERIDVRGLVPDGVDRNHWPVNVVRHLNENLRHIRFHADGSKHGIMWEPWSG